MNKFSSNKQLFFILLLPFAYLLTKISRTFPNFIETYYSSSFYKIIATSLSVITGILPFSLSEIIVVCFSTFVLFNLLKISFQLIKYKNKRLDTLRNFVLNILAISGVIYFSFQLLWGFNYQRLSVEKIFELNIQDSSTTEVVDLCKYLIKNSNYLRENLNESKNGLMELPYDKSYMLKTAYLGYDEASLKYPKLRGNYGTPKSILLSIPMCYTGITGFYFPFTNEANVNTALPDSISPFTTAHEMAHQRGFAKEDETNYIAYIACINHPDKNFKYSGTLSALSYSFNALKKIDIKKFDELILSCSRGVLNDLNYNKRFWKGYSGTVEAIGDTMNDTYLKAQNQESGTKSYGAMVDLLLAERRKK
ncbi:DUF3810 domain-containing protein [Clostridium sp.]|uniref:DUF3810 domain-containing protein n=1 Tax=Clostridium sp. TaxID=1506 RepID=UPI003D6D819F